MAAVTRQLAAANDGAADISFTYDDVSNVIQSITARNDGLGTVTATLRDRVTGVVVVGPISRAVASGLLTQNLIPLNLTMVLVTRKAVLILEPPFVLTLEWSAA